MKTTIFYIGILSLSIFMANCQDQTQMDKSKEDKIVKTDEEWKSLLTPLQYHITREKGTERPFTGEYNNHFEKGTYHCVCCDAPLFESETKYESSCGWPSFFDSEFEKNITFKEDRSHGMIRTEVLCARCDAHLGHIFNDGPKPTGMRYCINSESLKFKKARD